MLVSNFSMVSLKFNEHVNQHSRKDFINLSRRPYYLIRVLLQNTDLMSIFTIFYLIVGEVGRNYNTYIRRLLLAVLQESLLRRVSRTIFYLKHHNQLLITESNCISQMANNISIHWFTHFIIKTDIFTDDRRYKSRYYRIPAFVMVAIWERLHACQHCQTLIFIFVLRDHNFKHLILPIHVDRSCIIS